MIQTIRCALGCASNLTICQKCKFKEYLTLPKQVLLLVSQNTCMSMKMLRVEIVKPQTTLWKFYDQTVL